MKRIAKRQFFLLGCASLAAMLLSLYDRYGIVLTSSSRSFLAEQSQLQEQVLRENQGKGGNRSTGQSGKESKTMAENKAGAETETAEKDERMASDANSDIRVLLCSDNYASEYHDRITITADVPFRVSGQGTERHCQAGEQVELTMQSDELLQGDLVFTMEEDGVFQLPYLKRAAECPSYEGSLHVEKREEGLILINTLPLETYLCYVVPSEMPSSYPIEALKAQAVCARCYAMLQMENSRCEEFGADLDDSVSYQVYNNIGKTDAAVQAVQQTAGMVIKEDGQIENTLYYSTSCGLRMEEEASNEAVFCAAMSGSRASDAEREESWYRWNTLFSTEELNAAAETFYPGQIGQILSLNVLKRLENGRAEVLQVTGTLGTVAIEGEYAIRQFLRPGDQAVILQDGSTAPSLGLLPSAFFYITTQYQGGVLSGFLLNGGGYGHGDGMSQNGAKHLAEEGWSCQEILKYYYGDGVEIICDT